MYCSSGPRLPRLVRAERLGLPTQTRCPVLFLLICLYCLVAEAFIFPPTSFNDGTPLGKRGVMQSSQHHHLHTTTRHGSGVSLRPTGFRRSTTRSAVITAPRPRPTKEGVVGSEQSRDLKLGVLLLQLGGPERADDVEGFLYNLFADPGEKDHDLYASRQSREMNSRYV